MIAKRIFDIAASAAGLVATAPVLVPVLVATWAQDRHSPFYVASRIARGGGTFRMVKVRSMIVGADKSGVDSTAADDRRITRVGAFVRRFKIDELPQLWNVLKGDMSLVGPRPERPFFVEQLTAEIPFYALRHSVKPGVTGWAQVRYPYGATVEDSQEKLQFDLYYVKNHTLFLDLVVLLETVGVVLTGKGAR